MSLYQKFLVYCNRHTGKKVWRWVFWLGQMAVLMSVLVFLGGVLKLVGEDCLLLATALLLAGQLTVIVGKNYRAGRRYYPPTRSEGGFWSP